MNKRESSNENIFDASEISNLGRSSEGGVIDATKFKVARLTLDGLAELEAHDIWGTDLNGTDIKLELLKATKYVILAFLSRKCESCIRIWEEAREGIQHLEIDTSFYVVTKDLIYENEAGSGDPGDGTVNVICSSKAWSEYLVPGNSHIVIIDSVNRKVLVDSGALNWNQVLSLVKRK